MTSEPVDKRVMLAGALREQVWTFAKTMASMPHDYVHQDKWTGSIPFEAAKEWIAQLGVPRRFMQQTYTYFRANGYRYWAMPAIKPGTYLINRAKE